MKTSESAASWMMAVPPQPSRLRVVIVHPALAPYRLDQFNMLSRLFDLTVIFLFANVWNHPFDQQRLLAQARFKTVFLLKGFEYKGRVFIRWGLLAAIRNAAPDVIISVEYSFATQILTLMKAIGLLKTKLGSTIDDSLAIAQRPQSRARRLARRLIVRNLDFLVVLSAAVADYYAARYRLDLARIVVSPLLQDANRLREESQTLDSFALEYTNRFSMSGRTVVLFVGRLIPEKGLLPFLKAVRAVFEATPNLLMMVVGDGGEREGLQNYIASAKLEDQVHLAGRFEGAALYAWYVCACGFVLPSNYEPFGAVVNEALIFGVPTLCSKVAGSAFLAAEAGGMLFDPFDPEASRASFAIFVQGLKPLRECRTLARASLMNGHMERTIKEWEKIDERQFAA